MDSLLLPFSSAIHSSDSERSRHENFEDLQETTKNETPIAKRVCFLCKDSYNAPKLLPCFHSFCSNCLDKYIQQHSIDEHFPCPLCKKCIPIPEERTQGLPDDVYLQIDEHYQKRSCEVCEDGLAESFCCDCLQTFCEKCSNLHRRMKSSMKHNIVQLSESTSGLKPLTLAEPFCPKHETEEIKFYCECKEYLCLICNSADHKLHNCKELSIVAERTKLDLKDHVKSLNEATESIFKRTAILKQSTKRLNELKNTTLQSTKDRVTSLKNILDELCEQEVSRLQKCFDTAIADLEEERIDHETEVDSMKYLTEYIQNVLWLGSNYDVVRLSTSLEQCLISNMRQKEIQIETSRDFEVVTEITENCSNLIATLNSFVGNSYLTYKILPPFPLQILCPLSKQELYVASEKNKYILHKNKLLRKVGDIPGLILDPRTIWSSNCLNSNNIYLAKPVYEKVTVPTTTWFGNVTTKTETKKVWKIQKLFFNSERVETCFTLYDCKSVRCVSCFKNEDVLIHYCDADSSFRLKRFSPDGKLVQDINPASSLAGNIRIGFNDKVFICINNNNVVRSVDEDMCSIRPRKYAYLVDKKIRDSKNIWSKTVRHGQSLFREQPCECLERKNCQFKQCVFDVCTESNCVVMSCKNEDCFHSSTNIQVHARSKDNSKAYLFQFPKHIQKVAMDTSGDIWAVSDNTMNCEITLLKGPFDTFL